MSKRILKLNRTAKKKTYKGKTGTDRRNWKKNKTQVQTPNTYIFGHSNSPPHRALGRYRHMSSSRQIHNIFCWLEILNYCPDGGNGNFHCSSSFLKATSLICEAQLSFAAHQKYILCFFSLWWMINLEFGLCFVFPPIYISVKQEAMAG